MPDEQLTAAQKARLKTIAEVWLKDAAQKNIVLIGGIQVENIDGKWFAIGRPNNDPLHYWKEPLD